MVVENQGAFVHGRFIAHNIMVCRDHRHYNRKNNGACCFFKLDFKKAYDTLEWEFLKEMLQGLGFTPRFISMVMECVTTPKFSLMLNGSMHGFFDSRRVGGV